MDKQEKTFLRRLAKNIAQDDPLISDKQIKNHLSLIVSNIPNGDLRRGLTENHKRCVAYLLRLVCKTIKKQSRLGDIPQKKGGKGSKGPGKGSKAIGAAEEGSQVNKAENEVAGSTPGQLSPSSTVLVGGQIVHLLQKKDFSEDTGDQIERLWVKADAGEDFLGLDRHCMIMMMTDACQHRHVLFNILAHCFRMQNRELKKTLQICSTEGMIDVAREKLTSLEKFLNMCLLRRTHFPEDANMKPSIGDYLVGLLSVYLDLFVTVYRGTDMSVGDQRRMIRLVKQVTWGMGQRSLDALLQMSVWEENTAYFSPLIRYLLRDRPEGKRCYSHYLRYVLTARKWRHLATDLSDVMQSVRLVRAPQRFMVWVGKWNPETLQLMPTDRKFKGHTVTAFIIDDADEEIIASLMKALVLFVKGSPIANADDDGDDDDEKDGQTAQQVSSGDTSKEGKKKKKKTKMKKVTVMEDKESCNDNDDEDRVSVASANSDEDAEMNDIISGDNDNIEVFDWTKLGEFETESSATASDAFIIDRGASVTEAAPRKKKKMLMTEASTSGLENGAGFFIDRGQTLEKESEQKLKVKKEKKKFEASGEIGKSENAAMFFIDRGQISKEELNLSQGRDFIEKKDKKEKENASPASNKAMTSEKKEKKDKDNASPVSNKAMTNERKGSSKSPRSDTHNASVTNQQNQSALLSQQEGQLSSSLPSTKVKQRKKTDTAADESSRLALFSPATQTVFDIARSVSARLEKWSETSSNGGDPYSPFTAGRKNASPTSVKATVVEQPVGKEEENGNDDDDNRDDGPIINSDDGDNKNDDDKDNGSRLNDDVPSSHLLLPEEEKVPESVSEQSSDSDLTAPPSLREHLKTPQSEDQGCTRIPKSADKTCSRTLQSVDKAQKRTSQSADDDRVMSPVYGDSAEAMVKKSPGETPESVTGTTEGKSNSEAKAGKERKRKSLMKDDIMESLHIAGEVKTPAQMEKRRWTSESVDSKTTAPQYGSTAGGAAADSSTSSIKPKTLKTTTPKAVKTPKTPKTVTPVSRRTRAQRKSIVPQPVASQQTQPTLTSHHRNTSPSKAAKSATQNTPADSKSAGNVDLETASPSKTSAADKNTTTASANSTRDTGIAETCSPQKTESKRLGADLDSAWSERSLRSRMAKQHEGDGDEGDKKEGEDTETLTAFTRIKTPKTKTVKGRDTEKETLKTIKGTEREEEPARESKEEEAEQTPPETGKHYQSKAVKRKSTSKASSFTSSSVSSSSERVKGKRRSLVRGTPSRKSLSSSVSSSVSSPVKHVSSALSSLSLADPETSTSPERLTRSQASKKGYNLRRSGISMDL